MSKRTLPGEPAGRIVVFQERSIRRTWHNEEGWFSVVDVVAILADSVNPSDYITIKGQHEFVFRRINVRN